MPGLEMDGAHIAVNRNQETNFKGCYAAGDCTGRPYQIAKAVGEGNVAAHAILEYLSALEKGE
jgi:thioredoxin reductase (NADPH)